MKFRRSESLSTRVLSGSRQALGRLPLVPERPKPERRLPKIAAFGAGAAAVVAAGVLFARHMMERTPGQEEPATTDWYRSEPARDIEPSADGAMPAMATPGEAKPDVTGLS